MTVLWTLGIYNEDPEKSILPTKEAVQKLKDMLIKHGRPDDIVWGLDLNFQSIDRNYISIEIDWTTPVDTICKLLSSIPPNSDVQIRITKK